jgi:hypothetical protein
MDALLLAVRLQIVNLTFSELIISQITIVIDSSSDALLGILAGSARLQVIRMRVGPPRRCRDHWITFAVGIILAAQKRSMSAVIDCQLSQIQIQIRDCHLCLGPEPCLQLFLVQNLSN